MSGVGKLKLKGEDTAVAGGIKKKKKRSKKEIQEVHGQRVAQETVDGTYLEAPEEAADRRTTAEKRYDEAMTKREADRIRKHADKSHRQRVAEFNTYLSKLTEHHDIPKVGPG